MGTIFHNQNVINSRINSVPEVKIIFVVIAWVVMYLSILNVENHLHYIVNYVLKQIFLKKIHFNYMMLNVLNVKISLILYKMIHIFIVLKMKK